ncbi:hypothetical protein [Methylobacterium sp. E-045]|uniref:hypothetical protein n=1 Tax=Methylobacterium sp. E-045 TaxID=2836575 RepID=UPI001FB999AA|nr:hypothetical protein [Methylobacterium sp. E-045]MCJ2129196.1 hypothetical protein [Methylobacterium sp. E-045]
MTALVLAFLGIVLVADAVLIASLSSNRVSGDPAAMRTGAAFAGLVLAASAMCLIAARFAA